MSTNIGSPFMKTHARIYVAGHRGLVGSAIKEALRAQGYDNVLYRTHAELDLLDAKAVDDFLASKKPEFVFLAAAKVGGIMANQTCPASFIRENLVIQTNVMEASRKAGVQRLLFLGSSCIYPKVAPQPMPESCLLDGPLEPTNRPYALAKISGIEMCRSYNHQYGSHYLAVMPTNLYGPGDNFDLHTSHVLPALIRKTVEAKLRKEQHLIVWGSGKPLREFMHSSDLAEACVFLMNLDEVRFNSLMPLDEPPLVNIGTGEEISIHDLAELVAKVMDYRGKLIFDETKPDGTPRKLLNVERLHKLGWHHEIELEEGIRETCQWYLVEKEISKEELELHPC
jgi:GDP-L-fucose synthase